MSVREAINKRPGLGVVVVVVLCLLAAGILFSQLRDSEFSSSDQKEWYTIDDGQNWFADDASKLPPFMRDGKAAYRCRVWVCEGSSKKFVSHLERLQPDAKKKLEGLHGKRDEIEVELAKIEVKLPLTGDTGWVDINSPQAQTITTPKCAEGSNELIRMVPPE